MREIEITMLKSKLDNLTVIESNILGPIEFKWSVETIKNVKILEYKIGDYDETYNVSYDIIINNMTLVEYFKNVINLIVEQVMMYKEGLLTEDKGIHTDDIAFIKYFEELINDRKL